MSTLGFSFPELGWVAGGFSFGTHHRMTRLRLVSLFLLHVLAFVLACMPFRHRAAGFASTSRVKPMVILVHALLCSTTTQSKPSKDWHPRFPRLQHVDRMHPHQFHGNQTKKAASSLEDTKKTLMSDTSIVRGSMSRVASWTRGDGRTWAWYIRRWQRSYKSSWSIVVGRASMETLNCKRLAWYFLHHLPKRLVTPQA